jgi:hypothetical protein
MLSKLALLLQSKTALAALGVLLVGSGGTAVAVTAASGHVPFTNISMSSSHTSAQSGSMPAMQQTPDAQATGNAHANSVAIEGILKATTASTTATATATTATTTATGAMTTAKTAITSISVQTPGSKKVVTILVNAQTRVTGKAHTLAQLAKYRGHRVQVQADKTGTTLTAWKVTVEGMTTSGTPTPATGTATGTAGSGTGTAGGQNGTSGQQQDVMGTVTSVSVRAASFLVRVSDATFVRVVVTPTTQFSGTVMTLSALRTGTHVVVNGTMQANGTLLATSVQSVPR